MKAKPLILCKMTDGMVSLDRWFEIFGNIFFRSTKIISNLSEKMYPILHKFTLP